MGTQAPERAEHSSHLKEECSLEAVKRGGDRSAEGVRRPRTATIASSSCRRFTAEPTPTPRTGGSHRQRHRGETGGTEHGNVDGTADAVGRRGGSRLFDPTR